MAKGWTLVRILLAAFGGWLLGLATAVWLIEAGL